MKGKVTALLLSFAIVFCVGMSVAYYNTRTFGFDEDADVVSQDDEKISIMDFDIYYKDVNNIIKKAKYFVPDKHFAI